MKITYIKTKNTDREILFDPDTMRIYKCGTLQIIKEHRYNNDKLGWKVLTYKKGEWQIFKRRIEIYPHKLEQTDEQREIFFDTPSDIRKPHPDFPIEEFDYKFYLSKIAEEENE